MYERNILFFRAIRLRRSRSSVSETGLARFKSLSSRISFGTILATSWSRSFIPIVWSISSISFGRGPTCRHWKASLGSRLSRRNFVAALAVPTVFFSLWPLGATEYLDCPSKFARGGATCCQHGQIPPALVLLTDPTRLAYPQRRYISFKFSASNLECSVLRLRN